MSLSVDIRHDFGEVALEVAFEAKGGVTALFGRSGAGKTSVVDAVAGLLRVDRGRIVLNDVVLLDTEAGVFVPPHKRRIGYVFQDGRLFPHLNVGENLRFGARFSGGIDAGHEARVVAMLGLEALLERRVMALSGGEKQRVALGRALLARPQMLLMDEPLAALDEARKEEILPYLERLRDEAGLPILYVSHAVGEIARLADVLVLLAAGRVALAGAAAEVLSDPGAVGLLGVREAGAVLRARVVEHCDDGLVRLAVSGGELLIPGVEAPVGAGVRIRVLAQDVILAREAPKGLSSRNILAVVVDGVRMGDGPGAMVSLIAGEDRLLARITARSVHELGLAPGVSGFAILKATAVPRGAIGAGG
jgi:molybdate transport system ATP-binding protein